MSVGPGLQAAMPWQLVASSQSMKLSPSSSMPFRRSRPRERRRSLAQRRTCRPWGTARWSCTRASTRAPSRRPRGPAPYAAPHSLPPTFVQVRMHTPAPVPSSRHAPVVEKPTVHAAIVMLHSPVQPPPGQPVEVSSKQVMPRQSPLTLQGPPRSPVGPPVLVLVAVAVADVVVVVGRGPRWCCRCRRPCRLCPSPPWSSWSTWCSPPAPVVVVPPPLHAAVITTPATSSVPIRSLRHWLELPQRKATGWSPRPDFHLHPGRAIVGRVAQGESQGLPPRQKPTPAGNMSVLSHLPAPQSASLQQSLPQLPSGPGRQVEPPLQWLPALLGAARLTEVLVVRSSVAVVAAALEVAGFAARGVARLVGDGVALDGSTDGDAGAGRGARHGDSAGDIHLRGRGREARGLARGVHAGDERVDSGLVGRGAGGIGAVDAADAAGGDVARAPSVGSSSASPQVAQSPAGKTPTQLPAPPVPELEPVALDGGARGGGGGVAGGAWRSTSIRPCRWCRSWRWCTPRTARGVMTAATRSQGRMFMVGSPRVKGDDVAAKTATSSGDSSQFRDPTSPAPAR